MTDTSMSLDVGGNVQLQQRTAQDERGYWQQAEILDHVEIERMSLMVGYSDEDNDEDPSLLTIDLWAHHIHSEITGEHYHTALKARLTLAQARELNRYLAFVLDVANAT